MKLFSTPLRLTVDIISVPFAVPPRGIAPPVLQLARPNPLPVSADIAPLFVFAAATACKWETWLG